MKRTAWSLMLVASLLALPQTAESQVLLAPELAIGDDVDFGVGGRALFGLSSVQPALQAAGFITIFFPGENVSYFELGGTLYYRFILPDNPGIVPKAGAGVTVARGSSDYSIPGEGESSSSSTNVGLHLLGGLELPRGKIVPYGEVQAGIGDIPSFAIRVGVGFAVGGGGVGNGS